MTPHIESKKEDIADIVLMPGDPLRAKFIAEHYLDDYRLINQVRNMFGYTGTYKGKKVTVFGSGMGIPSIGIYAYELFHFYEVKKIIRIGSCGGLHPDVKLRDLLLAESVFCRTDFDLLLGDASIDDITASQTLNDQIINTASELNIPLKTGKIITTDVFDIYVDHEKYMKNFPEDNYLGAEMEAFGLFYLAKFLNKEAACLLTVVDSKFDKAELSREDRETSLCEMIELALESITK